MMYEDEAEGKYHCEPHEFASFCADPGHTSPQPSPCTSMELCQASFVSLLL
jgi:hypothetical protein